ncbi:MAG: 3-dehydroquinate synthase [Nitrospirae bacterium]|nr:3-dehydroquinate synthase [Nitrospirota bacterium]
MKKNDQQIVLVGFMGVGKSTIGRLLSRETGFPFIDTDQKIVEKEQKTIPEIFHEKGEPYFRMIERELIKKITEREAAQVIATGGGALLDPENVRNLKRRGILICLKASAEEILKRVKNGRNRPLLQSDNLSETIPNLMKQREESYETADMVIQTDHKKPHQIYDEIKNRLSVLPSVDQFSISVELGREKSYPIHLGTGSLRQIGGHLAGPTRDKIAIITNPLVWKLHGAALKQSLVQSGFNPLVIQIPDGERYKTLSSANTVYGELLKNKFERSSPILAFGGGVIGDLAGFVSGTFLRGTPFIQVPTTLIAQVDSSIGGKTGVNHPLGKNLIGVFHQPKFVWIDTELLQTLKKRDYISGLGEVVKYGVIADARLFEFLEQNKERILAREPEALFHLVKRSCEIKAGVVSQDEKESGIRKTLNYGHTMGHALESATHYQKYRHGEAIGIGMHFAALLGVKTQDCSEALVKRQEALIESLQLPAALPGSLRGSDLLNSMSLDKKVQEGKIYFILPQKIGEVTIRQVDKALIRETIKTCQTTR